MNADQLDCRALLERQRAHLTRYDVAPIYGDVVSLAAKDGGFAAKAVVEHGGLRSFSASRVATGAAAVEPDLPGLSDAVRHGLVRYCPVCDGYEAADKRIAVIGFGDRGLWGSAVRRPHLFARRHAFDLGPIDASGAPRLLSLGAAPT